MALVTLVAVGAGASAAAAGLLYFLTVVLLSLRIGLAPAALTSLVAVLCLDYFFTPPLFRVSVSDPTDVVAVTAFGAAAVIVTQLLARLRLSEARWRDVFENNPTMYFIVDESGTVLSVNPFGAEQLGYTIDELVGTSVLRVFHDADRDAAQAHVAACLADVGRTMTWELRKVRKDGSELRVRETARAVPRPPGRPVVLVACEDVTEQRRTEEALRQAQSELARVTRLTTMGELAASIAHEIRQPLAAIVMNGGALLRWLGRDEPDLEEARASVARIVGDAARAEDVIRGVRMLAQKSGPRLSPLDLTETIEEVLTLVGGELRRHSVSVDTDLDTRGRAVLGDRVQLQQVLLNLILNGVEAMSRVDDRPRLLTIATGRAGGRDGEGEREVVVTVSDSGRGFEPATAEQIFEPFFSTKPAGLGIGLAICRSIVDAHGGRIWAEPRVPYGTTVRFTLPLAADG